MYSARTPALLLAVALAVIARAQDSVAPGGSSGRVEVLPTKQDLLQQIEFQSSMVTRAQQSLAYAQKDLSKFTPGTPEHAQARKDVASAQADVQLQQATLARMQADLKQQEFQQPGKPTERPVDLGGEPEITVGPGGIPGQMLLPPGGRTPPSPPSPAGGAAPSAPSTPASTPTTTSQNPSPPAPDPTIAQQEAMALALEAKLRVRSAELKAISDRMGTAMANAGQIYGEGSARVAEQSGLIMQKIDAFLPGSERWNEAEERGLAIVAALWGAQARAEKAPLVMDLFLKAAEQAIADCKGNRQCRQALAIIDGARQGYQSVNAMSGEAAKLETEMARICAQGAANRAAYAELQGLFAARQATAAGYLAKWRAHDGEWHSLYKAFKDLAVTAQAEHDGGLAALTALSPARKAAVSGALVLPTMMLIGPSSNTEDALFQYGIYGPDKGPAADMAAKLSVVDGEVAKLKRDTDRAVGVIQAAVLETGAAFMGAKDLIAKAEAHCAAVATAGGTGTLSNAEAPAGTSTVANAGGGGVLGNYATSVTQNAQQNAQNAGNNMQNQQQMQQSANAGNPAASGAQQTLNSGGGTAGDILNSGAGQTALGQQTVGFGNMLAGQTADNIRNILTTFTTTIATQGAGQVISQLWPTGGGSGGTAGGSGGSGGGSGGTGGATTTGGGAAGGGSGGGGSGGGGGQPPKPPDGGVAGTNATAGGATTNATGGGTTTTTTGSSNLTYYKLICEMCGKKIYMSDDGTTGSPGNCQNCGHSPLGYQAIGSTRPADYGSASPSFTAYKWTYPCDANVPGTDPKYLPCHKPQVRYYLYTPMSPNGRCPNCGWASTIQSTPF